MTTSLRTVTALLLTAGMALGACGGGADCGTIADDAIVVLQDTIDIVDGFSEDELTQFLGSGPGTPAAFAEVERRGDALVTAANEAGCSDAELRELLIARSDRLETDSDFGRFVLETLLDGAFFSDR